MTEIRMDVDLEHPPERVWRALTDRQLLPKWFAETDLEPRAGSLFGLEPIHVPGLGALIEGELIALDEPRRISMRWHTDELQTLVVWELTPTPAGCQLTVRESCVREQWEPEHRAQLTDSYHELYAVRLPAVLDWLAFREVDFAATVPGAARRRRRGRLLAGIGAVVVAAAGMITIVAAVRPDTPERATAAPGGPSAEPAPTSTPTASATSAPPARAVAANVAPSPSAAGARPGRPDATPGRPSAGAAQAVLAATYATVESQLFGYTGEITLSNTGKAAASGWVVTVTLPASQSRVVDTSGASHTQNGRIVTFTGAAVAAGGSLRFQFEVGGAPAGEKKPAACAVGRQPCAGL